MLSFNILRSERFLRLSKEGLWVILGQAMAVLGSVVGVRLLTELIDPKAYGELALGMTLATLVNQTLLGPLSNGATRFYAPSVEEGDLGSYLTAIRRLVLFSTGIVVLLLLLTICGLLLAGSTQWIAISGIAFIFATIVGYNSILSGIQNAARQRSVVALHQGMEPWGRFMVAAGLLLWLGATSTVAMVGYSIAAILVLGSQYVFYRKIAQQKITNDLSVIRWQNKIRNYSWPISIFGVFTWAQLVSDRWALGLFTTTQEVGLYAVLFQLGYYPMSMATGIAMQFLSPIFFQQAGDASDNKRNAKVNKLIWHLTELILVLTGLAFLVTFFFHKQIFQLFVAKEYSSASNLLPWIVVAGGVFAAGQASALTLASQMRTQMLLAPKIVTALLGVTLNIAGAYWYGTTGIVIASVLFSMSFFLWIAVLSKKGD